jgi:cell division protein FtsI (penicillin-binding protein 3)
MPPRSDEPPRRGQPPRRGVSREVPPADDDEGARGFAGIGDARAYTPRGRTVAERDQRTRSPRAGRTTDPFRPALQVLDGGRPADRRAADEDAPARGRRGGDESDAPARGRRGDESDAPARGRRGDESDAPARGRRGDESDAPARGRRGGEPDTATRGRRGGRDRTDPPRGRRTGRDDAGLDEDHDDDPPHRGRTARRDAGRDRVPRERPAERARTSERQATRVTAGGSRLRAAGGGRTEAGTRTARDRTVADQPGPRRTAGARPVKAVPPPRAGGRRPAPPLPAEPPKLANSTRRLRIGTVLALALFATIGVRLVVLQVVESPESVESLLRQRQNRLTEVVLPAPRGSILDRSGAVLAHSVEARYIYADPELVQNPKAVAAKLSPLLGVAPSRLEQLMAKKKRPGGGASRFEYLARGVDVTVADRIAAMNLPGIGEDRDERRDVPGADLAANLIGFTGEDHTGLEGLEARYDELLRGTDGERVFETGNPNVDKGRLAKEIPGGYHRETRAQPGTSLQLTIDRDLQFEVQRVLSEYMEKENATVAGAVVLDVRSGEVLAQASYPAYNAQKPFDYKPTEREDVPTSVITDPGSTHKAFIFGAALQEGVIKPDSVLTIGPGFRRGGFDFFDTHRQPKGTKMTMAGLLAYSSNVGTIMLADRLGKQRVYEYQQRFGLGRATGVGMPGEASGKLLAPNEWTASASGSIPIGHSVDATLIQMAAGYAAIANDGTYVQPHLIKATLPPDGDPVPSPPPATHKVLDPHVAAQLRTLMEAVVDSRGGTGTQAAVEGWRIAGKTGTGKRLIDGRYTKHNAGSFIGMAPADNPRYVIAVSADVPSGTGGDVAAPAFSEMMKATLLHYRVPPSGTRPPKFKLYP